MSMKPLLSKADITEKNYVRKIKIAGICPESIKQMNKHLFKKIY